MKIKNRLADVGLISAAVTAHRAGSSWLAALYVTKALPLSSPMLVCAWSNPRFDVYESRCNLNLSRDSKVRNISLSRDCRPHFDHLRAHPSSAIREGVTGRICIGWACDVSTNWARTAPNRGKYLISGFFAHSAPAFNDAGTAVRSLRMAGEHRVVPKQPTLSETNKGSGCRATL